ncbi:MAG: uroporphyrinogen-III C-methyltransferase [Pseudomonadota bacterium]
MSGKLILIGCGPGAADLLTFRAANRIASADLVLYDRLIDPEILRGVRDTAETLYVGKRCGDGGRQQADINLRIAAALRAGQHVARLKSGDPMIFGRAVEELAIATDLNAEVEIVPGVTAALAAASDAKIGLTERAEIQSFTITTARTAKSLSVPEWSKLAQPGSCMGFYMGVAQAWRIQTALMSCGVPGNAPADWIERAGQDCMRAVSTRLDRLSLDAKTHEIQNPAVLIVRYPFSLAAAQADRARDAFARPNAQG